MHNKTSLTDDRQQIMFYHLAYGRKVVLWEQSIQSVLEIKKTPSLGNISCRDGSHPDSGHPYCWPSISQMIQTNSLRVEIKSSMG